MYTRNLKCVCVLITFYIISSTFLNSRSYNARLNTEPIKLRNVLEKLLLMLKNLYFLKKKNPTTNDIITNAIFQFVH